MELQTLTGKKTLVFKKFSALEGWDLHDRFASFAGSKDAVKRRAYVMRVLAGARVMLGSQELPLSTDALIDNHLCSPENVGKVFAAVLDFNGISIERSAARSDYVTAVGNEIATSFIAACFGALEQFVAAVTSENNNGR